MSTQDTATSPETTAAAPGKRRAVTLDMLSPSQASAIRSIPPLGDWPLPEETWTRPVSYFFDAGIFAREMALFKRQPVPVGPSGLLPRPGTSIAHDLYGVPLLLTRDAGGRAHVFLNACQHKGAKLTEDNQTCREGRRIVCPYHGWTYDLDGTLFGVAQPATFPGVSKADRSLAALPCLEAGGVIWVILDRNAPADFSDVVPELSLDLDHLGIPRAHVYGRRSFAVQANWKLVLEPFMENYHVRRLHSRSIGGMFADSPSLVHKFGPHQRKTKGRGNFDPKMLEDPGTDIYQVVNQVYQLFPNGMLITSPYYITLMIVIPTAIDQSQVDVFMLTPGPATSQKVEDLFARSFELAMKVFSTEDFRAAEWSQTGLASGALSEVIYGGMEFTIPRYYEQLDAYTARSSVP